MSDPAFSHTLHDAELLSVALIEQAANLARSIRSAQEELERLVPARTVTQDVIHSDAASPTPPGIPKMTGPSTPGATAAGAGVSSEAGTGAQGAKAHIEAARSATSIHESHFIAGHYFSLATAVLDDSDAAMDFYEGRGISCAAELHRRLGQRPGYRHMSRWICAFMIWYSQLKEPPRSGLLHALTESQLFFALRTVVIITNAVTASVAVNYEIQHPDMAGLEWQFYAEVFFVLFYVVELVMKLTVHRGFFFINDSAGWNNFDLGLVLIGIYDVVLQSLAWQSMRGSGSNFVIARIGRLLRLSRLLRVFRAIRFVTPLRQMLNSIFVSLSMLFWALVVLLLLWWILSVVLLQGFAPVLWDEQRDVEVREAIVDRFGSIPRAMLTLFSIVTGGDDWEGTYHLVAMAGDVYAFVLLFYLSFFTISLISVLTGIVVEHVVTESQMDDYDREMHFRSKKYSQGQDLKRLFEKMDINMSGKISEQEFTTAMKDHQVLAMMDENGVAPRDAHTFFKLLHSKTKDQGQDGVDAEEFVDGFMQMRGAAAGIDVQILIYQADTLMKQIGRQRQDLHEVKTMLRNSNRESSSTERQRTSTQHQQGHVTFEEVEQTCKQSATKSPQLPARSWDALEEECAPSSTLHGFPIDSEKTI